MYTGAEPDSIDPSLPQLAAALDPSIMRIHLAALVQLQHGDELSNVIVEHARLRPGKCCVIGYRLSLRSSISFLTRDLRMTARVYPRSESTSRHAGACARLSADDRFKHAPAHLAELGMLVWAFPQERKLKSLDVISNPDRVRDELLPQLPGFSGLPGPHGLPESTSSDLAHADIGIVHYVPEHGCTVRVSMAGCTLYAKHYLPGESSRANQILTELKNVLSHQIPELRTPTPLMHMAEIDVLWTEGLPGDTLMDRLNRRSISSEDWERIAIAVSRLHGTRLNSATPIARTAVIERLERVASASEGLSGGSTDRSTDGTAHRLMRAQARRLRTLVDRLKEQADSIDFNQQVTLHGDLHPKNILLDEHGACLIDLDAVALGPACLDLGSFCAALLYQALLSEQDLARTHQSLNDILQAYGRRASVDSGEMAWATAVALISERCYRCLTRLKPGRVSLIEKLLDTVEQILTQNSCTPPAQLRRPDAKSAAGSSPYCGSDYGSKNRSFAAWQDLRQMRQRLNQTILPALASKSGLAHAAVLDCEVIEARYHRYLNAASIGKSSMSIGYRLVMSNSQIEWIFIRACRDAGSRACFEQRPDPKDDAVHLPEFDAVVWRFPDDPSLPQLRELLDPVRMQRHLPWTAASVETELVKYRPGHRCALQYRLVGNPQHNPIGFAKTFSDQRGRLLQARLRQLALHCNGWLAEGVSMPRVLCYQERLNTVWFDYAPGHPLERAEDITDNPVLIERMGAALANLHSSALTEAATITPTALLKDATKKVAKICTEHADMRPPFQHALNLLTELAARLPTPESASLHGDCHLGQWLQHRDQLMLVDFDEMICGDPALDLSNFAVDLTVRGASEASVEQIVELLLSAYERHSARIGRNRQIHRCWYHWHSIVHWINRAYRLFLQQRPGLAGSLARVVPRLETACRSLRTQPMGASA